VSETDKKDFAAFLYENENLKWALEAAVSVNRRSELYDHRLGLPFSLTGEYGDRRTFC
jgi:hypothetical protein